MRYNLITSKKTYRMNQSYHSSDDFTAYLSHQTMKRLKSILYTVSSTLFWGGKAIARGFDETIYELSDMVDLPALRSVRWIRLSMEWLANEAKTASKRLFSTLRDEFESMGLWTIERQKARQGKQQEITRLLAIDFGALLQLARAAVLRIHELCAAEGTEPDWAAILPEHGFGFLGGCFKQIYGHSLLLSEDQIQEVAESRDAMLKGRSYEDLMKEKEEGRSDEPNTPMGNPFDFERLMRLADLDL